jgi:DeoR family transcriptional regulator, suf operon transcriptional repressor
MASALPLIDPDLPLGQRGQRGTVLLQLKLGRELTAKDLASRLGLSLNAVRHHLKELELEGLVGHQRLHRGVGAPVFVYRLSAGGEALFPRRYDQALTAMLDHVVEHEGRDAAVALLESYFDALARRLRGDLAAADPEARLRAVAKALSEEGYMAEGTAQAGSGVLVEHNCALPAVAERFPEICAAEARFLAEVLGGRVNRREHIMSGCPACEYHVRFGAEDETQEQS